jgi:hypothetical protein
MWYCSYGGQSIGRLLHFIECLQGFNMMEDCTVGNGKINYWGKVVATYTFVDLPESKDVPKFTFIEKYAPSPEEYDRREKVAIMAGQIGQAKYELGILEREYSRIRGKVGLTRDIFKTSGIPDDYQLELEHDEAEMRRLQGLIDAAKERVNYAEEHRYDYVRLQ